MLSDVIRKMKSSVSETHGVEPQDEAFAAVTCRRGKEKGHVAVNGRFNSSALRGMQGGAPCGGFADMPSGAPLTFAFLPL